MTNKLAHLSDDDCDLLIAILGEFLEDRIDLNTDAPGTDPESDLEILSLTNFLAKVAPEGIEPPN